MGTAESFYTRTTRFSGIKSAARILGVVGANLTMVQAASIVFDNQYAVLNEDYILRVYGQEVYSLVSQLIPVRMAQDCQDHPSAEVAELMGSSTEDAQTIMLAGILARAQKSEALPMSDARPFLRRQTELLRFIPAGNPDIYHAATQYLYGTLS
jgi:hypothetical protein